MRSWNTYPASCGSSAGRPSRLWMSAITACTYIGQMISTTGSLMQSIAQAWLVLELTHSGAALGVATLQGPGLAQRAGG